MVCLLWSESVVELADSVRFSLVSHWQNVKWTKMYHQKSCVSCHFVHCSEMTLQSVLSPWCTAQLATGAGLVQKRASLLQLGQIEVGSCPYDKQTVTESSHLLLCSSILFSVPHLPESCTICFPFMSLESSSQSTGGLRMFEGQGGKNSKKGHLIYVLRRQNAKSRATYLALYCIFSIGRAP